MYFSSPLESKYEDTKSLNNFQSQHSELGVSNVILCSTGRFPLAIPSWEDTLNSATKQKIPFLELQKKGNRNKAKFLWGPDQTLVPKGQQVPDFPESLRQDSISQAVSFGAPSQSHLTPNDTTSSQTKRSQLRTSLPAFKQCWYHSILLCSTPERRSLLQEQIKEHDSPRGLSCEERVMPTQNTLILTGEFPAL